MPPPLAAKGVTYSDGTKATIEQEAHDVVTFLAWASEPKMEERKRFGFGAMVFLIVLAGVLFAAYQQALERPALELSQIRGIAPRTCHDKRALPIRKRPFS